MSAQDDLKNAQHYRDSDFCRELWFATPGLGRRLGEEAAEVLPVCTHENVKNGKEQLTICKNVVARNACTSVRATDDSSEQKSLMHESSPSLYATCNIGDVTDDIYCTETFAIDPKKECDPWGPLSSSWKGFKPMRTMVNGALTKAQEFAKEEPRMDRSWTNRCVDYVTSD